MGVGGSVNLKTHSRTPLVVYLNIFKRLHRNVSERRAVRYEQTLQHCHNFFVSQYTSKLKEVTDRFGN